MINRPNKREPRTTSRLWALALLAICLSSFAGASASIAAQGAASSSDKGWVAPNGHRFLHQPKKAALDVPDSLGLTAALSNVAGPKAVKNSAKKRGFSSTAKGGPKLKLASLSRVQKLASSVKTTRSLALVAGTIASGPGIAGAVGSTTLIVYDTTGTYGPLGQLYAMATANLASHFGPWTAEPISAYQSGQLNQFTAVVYMGSTYNEPLPQSFLADVYNTQKPVIWAYDNIWELTSSFTGFQAKYGWNWSQFDNSSVSTVTYKGISLSRDPQNGAGIMSYAANMDTTKAHVLATATRADGTTFPWAIASGNLTYIGENPYVYSSETDRISAFEDILYNALDPSAPTRHVALLRFEDLDPTWTASDITNAADTAQAAGAPFGYGVISHYLNPLAQTSQQKGKPTPSTDVTLAQSPAVVKALNYLAAHGGTSIMHGNTHQYSNVINPYTGITGDDFEFYRVTQNLDHSPNFVGPIPGDSTSWALSRVTAATTDFSKAKLPTPQIFEFPHYTASATDYAAIASKFAVRWERALYYPGLFSGSASNSYSQAIGQMFPYQVQDMYGNLVLPENLGDYEPEPFYTFPVHLVSDVLAAGKTRLAVRDGVAGVYYHAFNGTQPLADILTGLKGQGWTFADPAKLSGLTATTPVSNSAVPTISGILQVGQTLTAANGSWGGSPTLFGHQWFDCDSSGQNCAAIYGANAATYKIALSDAGATLRVQLTAEGALYGQALATSAQTAALPAAPKNTALPTISGTPQVGALLTASNGSWSGSLTSFSYQWSVCDNAWFGCVLVSGATAQSYTPDANAQGHQIMVTVTATNANGSSKADSAWSAVVSAASPPVNTAPPTISGSTQQGQTLTISNGSWSGSQPLNYYYQWLRCDSSGANCAIVSGATAQTYVLVAADVGHTMEAWVSAANSAGSQTVTTAPTATVVGLQGAPPANTTAPVISGTPQAGQTLTASTGSWSGSPTGYSYQWSVCDSAWYGCVPVSGQTATSYVVSQDAVGHEVAVTVTATNAGGSTAVTSAWTSQVTAAAAATAPQNTALPVISGITAQGQTLTVSNGSWSGTQPLNYYYQWLRCDSSGANCAIVSGATAQTYVLASADVGHTMSAWVSAANSAGSTTATAAASAVITAPQSGSPVNSALPLISGTTQEGQTLSASTGSWSNSPTGYAFQWQRCDSSGTSCAAISGATTQTYLLAAADVGSTMRVTVTASNFSGSTSAQSAQTAVVAAVSVSAPQNTALPVVSGTAQIGQALSTTTGNWTNSPTSYAYQWLACDSSGANCAAISGATTANYTVQSSDAGATLRALVTATNSGGSTSAQSAQTQVVPAPSSAPQNTSLPTISGTAQVGQTLQASAGTWSGSPAPTFSYQWLSCNRQGTSCANISGASSQSYTLQAGDRNNTIRVAVTATNSAGSASAQSAATGVVAR